MQIYQTIFRINITFALCFSTHKVCSLNCKSLPEVPETEPVSLCPQVLVSQDCAL